ncbi:phenylalanine--tRNA ligase subunit beta [Candidatus Peregrinibacteria bacterium]|nr:phenylalanine--tRNA ligase subunit beta [Candidatus Peregrinibacteria bacterium]
MKISLDWLSDFVTFTVKDPEEIARRITAGAAEVDAMEKQGALLEHTCVGKVFSIAKHPNADKLFLCEVKTDRGTKKVVCGGTNLHEGMNVAFAHTGARVKWHGEELTTLEKVKIRGEESEGMICAGEELGIEHLYPARKDQGERPIVDLGENMEAHVGKSLRSVFGMHDTVLHIDNHAITHRADLFSHIGFARECVAIGIAKWSQRGSSLPDRQAGIRGPEAKSLKFGKDKIPFKFVIDSPELMPRYCACMIEIDGLGATPEWMRKRIEAVGWRSINLPIDITNFVASEVGVPLHSFDVDDIKGTVRMRTSKKGEKIVTLDEKERELPEGALVLSDDLGIFDLLGIMGGLRSSTKETTRRIYLHSASLDPVSIRKTVIATGHRTDAATVYEKGVPHITTEQGFYRAVELFLAHVPGARIVSKKEEVGTNGKAKPITISDEKINRMLGVDVPTKKVETILKDFGFGVKTKNQKPKTQNFVVTPPLWRLGDIRGEHDLVEEIGRVIGFNEIAPVLPEARIDPPARDTRLLRIRDALKEERYNELVPLSLVGPALLQKAGLDPGKAVKVGNPIGEELSLMQPSVLPGLLEHAEKSILHVEERLRTFTVSKVFRSVTDEYLELGLLFAWRRQEGIKRDPFLRAKAHMTYALAAAGYRLEIALPSSVPNFAHSGRTAKLTVQGKEVGVLCELSPAIRQRCGLPHRAAIVLLNVTDLFTLTPQPTIVKPVPEFPAISYDITLTMQPKNRTADILGKIRGKHELLESVEIADLYGGKPLAEGQYNLTLRLTYRAKDRTLKEEAVQKIHTGLLKSLGAAA